jgi:drug/metabolite transporter (DMT)-like permease
MRQTTRQHGIAFALAAALLFGASAPFAKLLLSETSPQLLAGLLYAGSGVGLGVGWLLRHGRAAERRESALTRKDAPWLAGAIVFGGIAAPVLLMIGLARTPASATSLLLNLEGVFTALLAWFVFHENFDRRIALGMLAILSGGAILSWQGAVAWGGIAGPLAVAAACLCWAIDNNLTQKVSASDPLQIAMYKGLAAGTVNTAIALALGASLPPIARTAAAAALGFLSYGVSLVLFVLALRMLGTARTGAYFSTAPFIGAVLSIAVFHERPSVALIAAAVLMGAGVWLHVTEVHKHEHVHEAMEHAHAHVHDEHHQHQHGPNDPAMTDPRPHSHPHRHEPVTHSHPHYPDIHHRHSHEA